MGVAGWDTIQASCVLGYFTPNCFAFGNIYYKMYVFHKICEIKNFDTPRKYSSRVIYTYIHIFSAPKPYTEKWTLNPTIGVVEADWVCLLALG